jgi:hypothetical protein
MTSKGNISVYIKGHTKHTLPSVSRMQSFSVLKQLVHRVTTRLQRFNCNLFDAKPSYKNRHIRYM